jgi:hypothetical protein
MPYTPHVDWKVLSVGPDGGNPDVDVTIADGDDAALGAQADAAASSDTGTFSLIALFKRSLQRLTSLIGIAHDDADGGNPILMGAHALAHGSSPTAVAAGDRTRVYANRDGIPWVIGGHPNVVPVRANYAAAQTNTSLVTVSGGSKIVVTRFMVTADKANSNDTGVFAGFGAATTPTTTGVIAAHPGIEAGGGFVTGDGSGILGVGADGEDLRVTSEDPGGSIDVVVSYYTVPS